VVGVRGPFGTNWSIDTAAGKDLLIVAGGVGLAPLRPVLLGALANREAYGRITLVAGARGPDEFLFREELLGWGATEGSTSRSPSTNPRQAGPGRSASSPSRWRG
jgi:NAD(P)H-flavin reductase